MPMIEFANQYFLVPLKDKQSLFYIGDRDALDALLIVLNKTDKEVIATSGVHPDTCYLMFDMDNEEANKYLIEASAIRANAIKETKHE